MNSFTLEMSFLGPTRGRYQNLHFNIAHLEQIGVSFCKTLVDYVENTERVARVYNELKGRFPQGSGTNSNFVANRPSNQYNNKQDEDKNL